MKHLKLYEAFCEGDMEDMLSYIRSVIDDRFEILHYGFDYIEIKLDAYGNSTDEAEEIENVIVPYLLDKFDKEISEIYTEETGWFKIYLNHTDIKRHNA